MNWKFDWKKYFLRNVLKEKRKEQEEIKKQAKYFEGIIENINDKIKKEREELENNEELKDFLNHY